MGYLIGYNMLTLDSSHDRRVDEEYQQETLQTEQKLKRLQT